MFRLVFLLLTVAGCLAFGTDVTNTFARGSALSLATVGIPASFTITAKDSSGQMSFVDTDIFFVEMLGTRSIRGVAAPKGDGTIPVSYIGTKSGSYDMNVVLATGGGLWREMYENVWFFYTPVSTSISSVIDINWGTGLITPSAADYVSIRWSGLLKPNYAETYTFYIDSDDGATLWIDSVKVIDRWSTYGNMTAGTIGLTTNVMCTIKLEYKDVTGPAHVSLYWESKSELKKVIPASAYYYTTHIQNSPFSVVLQPGPSCATTSALSGIGLSSFTAGGVGLFTIAINDAYGNTRTVGGDLFSTRLLPNGVRGIQGVWIDNSDGTYVVSYENYLAGPALVGASLLQQYGLTATFYDQGTQNPTLATQPAPTPTNPMTTYPVFSALTQIDPSVPALFWARYTGFIKPPIDGVYTFEMAVGSTSEGARTWVDNIVVIDQWATPSVPTLIASLSLKASSYYDLKVEYTSVAGAKSMNLRWKYAAAYAAIPSTNMFCGYNVSGSIGTLVSQTGPVSSTYSFVIGSALTLATVGTAASFTIITRDAFSNLYTVGGNRTDFQVTLSGIGSGSGDLADLGNGMYRVSYSPTTGCPNCKMDLNVLMRSSRVIGSPFALSVKPGRRHLASSPARGSSLTLATAGVVASVTITIRDAFSNAQPSADWGTPTTSAGLVFSLGGNGPAVTSTSCAATCPDGTSAVLVMSYTATVAGNFALSLTGTTLHDGAIMGSPFNLTVVPAAACATTSSNLNPVSLTLSTAGIPATFSVSVRDAFSNPRTPRNGGNFLDPIVAASRQTGVLDQIGAVQDLGNGRIITYNATLAGTNALWSRLAVAGGFVATYYDMFTLGAWPVPTSTVVDVNAVDWSGTSGSAADPSMGLNAFGARFSGFIRPTLMEVYTFAATMTSVSQTLKIWVDNSAVISVWATPCAPTLTGVADFTSYSANGFHDIAIEFGNTDTIATNRGLKLQWYSASHGISIITSDRIFAGYHLNGSPYTLKVSPAIACAAKSFTYLQALTIATAGSPASFYIQPRDAFGNTITTNGETFSVNVLSNSNLFSALNRVGETFIPTIYDGGATVLNATVVGLADGTGRYAASYTATKPGVFQMRTSLTQTGGLHGIYFENTDFTDKGQVAAGTISATWYYHRIDPTINFNWGTFGPVPAAEQVAKSKSFDSDFSVRWVGGLIPPYSETTTFTLFVGGELDGIKLLVNGLVVVSRQKNFIVNPAYPNVNTAGSVTAGGRRVDGTISLVANQYHAIQLEYQNFNGNASVQLLWSSRSSPVPSLIPPASLRFNATGKTLSNAGNNFYVQPTTVCSTNSVLYGPLVTVLTAGVSSSFTIYSRDSYNNPRKLGDSPFYDARLVYMVHDTVPVVLPTLPQVLTRMAGIVYPGGLTGTYYDNTGVRKSNVCFDGEWANRRCGRGPWETGGTITPTAALGFSYAAGDLMAGYSLSSATYTVRWLGFVRPSMASTYTFVLAVNSGQTAIATVNSATATASGTTAQFSTTFPTADIGYDIRVDYSAAGVSDRYFSLSWTYNGVNRPIPTSRLFPLAGNYRMAMTPTITGRYQLSSAVATKGGLYATYYDDQEMTVPVMTRIDATVNLNVASSVDYSSGPRNTLSLGLSDIQSFSVRWAGLIDTTVTSPLAVTFTVGVSNDGLFDERVRLFVDNSLLIDLWEIYAPLTQTQWTATVTLSSGVYAGYSDVKLEYKQFAGPSGIVQLTWSAGALANNLYYANHVSGSPFSPVVVKPNVICATTSKLRGVYLTTGTVGTPSAFVVQGYDQYGNERSSSDEFYVRLYSPTLPPVGPPVIRTSVLDVQDGSYEVTYTPTRSGTYTAVASLPVVGFIDATYYQDPSGANTPQNPSPIPGTINWAYPAGSAVPLIVSPWRFAAKYQGLLRPTSSELYTFTITVANTANEIATLYLDNKIVANVVSAGPVSVTGTFLCVANAYYDILVSYSQPTTDGGKALKLEWASASHALSIVATSNIYRRLDFPTATLTVSPALSCATGSFIQGQGLTIATAGTPSSFTVISRDSYGNLAFGAGDNFVVDVMDKSGNRLQHGDAISIPAALGSQYGVSWTMTASGTYEIWVRDPTGNGLAQEFYFSSRIAGIPDSTSVASTVDYSRNSTTVKKIAVRWTGFFLASLSEIYTFYVTANDNANFYVDKALLINKWDSPGGDNVHTATMVASAGRFYEIELQFRDTDGSATCHLEYATQSIARRTIPSSRLFRTPIHVFGSPFATTVLPAATCSAVSTFSQFSSSFSIGTAGVISKLLIRARDVFGNLRTRWSGTDNFAVRVTQDDNINVPIKADMIYNVQPGAVVASFFPTRATTHTIRVGMVSTPGLFATYYQHASANAPCFVSCDAQRTSYTYIDWSTATYPSGITALSQTYFSARFVGLYRTVPTDVEHTFQLLVKDSTERVRLWLDNALVINQWTSLSSLSPTGIFTFPAANGWHDLRIEYHEQTKAASQLSLLVKAGAGYVVESTRLFLHPTDIAGSPSPLIVKPGYADLLSSTFMGMSLTLATAGISSSFLITSRDTYGNQRSTGGDNFLIGTANFSCTVSDLADGTYVARYTPTESGVSELQAYFGSQIQSFVLRVQPGVRCASTTTANGDALSLSTAGVRVSFSVQSKDMYGNIRSVGNSGAEYIVKIASADSAEIHMREMDYLGTGSPLKNLGRFRAFYRTTRSGSFSISVGLPTSNGLNGTYYRDWNLTQGVLSRIDDSVNFDWGLGTPNDAVGAVDNFGVVWQGYIRPETADTYTFQVTLGGSDDRVRLWIHDKFVVDCWSSMALTAPLVSGTHRLQGNTMYDIRLQYRDMTSTAVANLKWMNTAITSFTTVASAYLFNGFNHVKGSPFSPTIFPNVACGAVSTVFGPGISIATSSVAAQFTIQARDEFGNPRTASNDPFVVKGIMSLKYDKPNLVGTVTAISGGSGLYVASYQPWLKQNTANRDAVTSTGGPWQEMTAALAVAGGLFATYYLPSVSVYVLNPDRYVPKGSTFTQTINWGPGLPPYTYTSTGAYAVRWGGFVRATATDTVTFSVVVGAGTVTNEGALLYIDGVRIVNFFSTSATVATGTYGLTAGTYYDLKLDYYTSLSTDNGLVQLYWQTTTIPSTIIPSTNLYQKHQVTAAIASGTGLQATYYDSTSFPTLSPLPMIVDSNIDWSVASAKGAPAGTLTNTLTQTAFLARWSGFVKPSRADLYTFSITTADPGFGEFMEVKVDNSLVIDTWSVAPTALSYSGTVLFPVAEQLYELSVRYRCLSTTTSRRFSLMWQNAGTFRVPFGVYPATGSTVSLAAVPSQRLYQQMSSTGILTRDDTVTYFPTSADRTGEDWQCRGQGLRSNPPLRVAVYPSASCASTTRVTGNAVTLMTAGIPATFSITARDSYLNIVDTTSEYLASTATLTSPYTVVRSSQALMPSMAASDPQNPNGRFTLSYLATVAGSYMHQVTLSSATQRGLLGSYYVGTALNGIALTRSDDNINFDWGLGAPMSQGIPADSFSVRWTGYISMPTTDTYTFYSTADEYFAVFIGGSSVFNTWNSNLNGLEVSGTISLAANILYDIRADYADLTGTANVVFLYSSKTDGKTVVPSLRLFQSAAPTLGGAAVLKIAPAVICATTSVISGVGVSLATAGIPVMFTITARDQFGNQRVPSIVRAGVEYDGFVRVVPESANTKAACATAACDGTTPRGEPLAGTSPGTHLVYLAMTAAGVHSLYASIAIGRNPQPTVDTSHGLVATYYNSDTQAFPAVAITDFSATNPVSLSYGGLNAPSQLVQDGMYSMKWAGLIFPTATTTYTFQLATLTNEERARLWIENKVIINAWTSLASVAPIVTYAMIQNQFYDIMIDYRCFGTTFATKTFSLNYGVGAAYGPYPSLNMYKAFDIGGGATRFTVNPAVACAAVSTQNYLHAVVTLATAGVIGSFTIWSKDEFGNTRAGLNDTWVARAYPRYLLDKYMTPFPNRAAIILGSSWPLSDVRIVRGNVSAQGDGSYKVIFNATRSGVWAFVSSLVSSSGLLVTDWTYPTNIATTLVVGTPASAVSQIQYTSAGPFARRWVGFVRPTTAETYTFQPVLLLITEDVRLWVDNSLIIDEWTGTASSLTPFGAYTFDTPNIYYDFALACQGPAGSGVDLQWKSASISQKTIPASVFFQSSPKNHNSFVVRATGPAVPSSIAFPSSLTLATAGTGVTFTILSRDIYGNERETDADMIFTAQVTGASGGAPVIATVIANPSATLNDYSASYLVTRAQRYSLSVRYLVSHISGSPFSVTVNPDVVCGATSTASGSGLTASVANSVSTLTITARDVYSNSKTAQAERTTQGCTFLVRVTRNAVGQGPTPDTYWDGMSAKHGVAAAAPTLKGSVSWATGGEYRVSWTQDATTNYDNYLHASWAVDSGLFATFYSITTIPYTLQNLQNLNSNLRYINFYPNFNLASTGTYTDLFGVSFVNLASQRYVAARWRGFIRPPAIASYSFKISFGSSTERFRMWIDNTLLINQWTSLATAAPGPLTTTLAVTSANAYFDFTMEYMGDMGATPRGLVLQWNYGLGDAIITSDRFFARYDVAGSPYQVISLN